MTLVHRYSSLFEALELRAADRTSPAIRFVAADESETRLEYRDILRCARAVAFHLWDRGIEAGDAVPMVVETGPAFFSAFYGIMSAGAIPVPLAAPIGVGVSPLDGSRTAMDPIAKRLLATCTYLAARYVVATSGVADGIRSLVPGVAVLDADEIYRAAREFPLLPSSSPSFEATDIAFLQCTSGSTGSPKGVMLSHRNLLSNLEQLRLRVEIKNRDVLVSWLPLHHDMGLIAGTFLPMYCGIETVLIPPQLFQRRPSVWLRAIGRHRGTLSPAPNFAYGYATARVKDAELEGIDLSSWRYAWCGAEQIDPRTMQTFQARFERFGLPRRAFRPCYGLAEASLCVTCVKPIDEFSYERVDREALAVDGVAQAASDEAAMSIVNVGEPVEGTEISIADVAGNGLPDGQIGRILVRGPSVMSGYWELPEVTAATFTGEWLDTGDLGYLRNGALYVTGRHKDIIIIRGRNYPPADFEWAAQTVAGVRLGATAALGIYDPEAGTERLHLVVESDLPAEEHDAIRRGVIAKVTEVAGLRPDFVHVVPRYSVPKTTSGKIRRGILREQIRRRGEAA